MRVNGDGAKSAGDPGAQLPEVYSAAEVALAAGVDPARVRQWADTHGIAPLIGGFYTTSSAVRLVRHLLSGVEVDAGRRELFDVRSGERARRALPVALTAAAHMALLVALGLVSAAASPARTSGAAPVATRLVFLAAPGPGGGGGGGGHKELIRASAAERKGTRRLRSPLPARPAPERAKPSATQPSPAPDPPVAIAPVVPVDADARDTVGEPVDVPPQPESRGPGAGGEAGAGSAAGIGPGNGAGIGAGSGGGTGGGPYRPGSDITPPSLLQEVKPDYTEEGRRRSVEGDVDLEIVVRSDGSVGDVTLTRGLGAGLDQRAIDAVRRWRFSPATRHGVPVDVIVQVSVEFRLR